MIPVAKSHRCKFAAGINNTSGLVAKFAAGVIGVVDTDGAP
jgi:hypothetical protein